MVNVGDHRKCPECETIGSVVWVSQDKKTMGVQCRRSHREASKAASKYGGKVVVSTKKGKTWFSLPQWDDEVLANLVLGLYHVNVLYGY